jgi:hypothetical protein
MMARERRLGPRLSGRTAYLLLALAGLGLLLASFQPLHVHGAGRAGFYNEECPLAELAGRHGQVSLPSAPPAVRIGLIIHPILVTEVLEYPAVSTSRTQPRAPPLA